jgi:hypothetical protein
MTAPEVKIDENLFSSDFTKDGDNYYTKATNNKLKITISERTAPACDAKITYDINL